MAWPQAWGAHWIWHEAPPTRDGLVAGELLPPPESWNRFCLLRRAFQLDSVPSSVPARVTADSRFVLFVNGVEAARGPARSLPERLPWVELDLAPLLRPGRNVVAAIVRFYGRPIAWWRPAPASGQFGFGSFAFEAPSLGLASDASWRAMPAPYAADTLGDPFYPAAEEIDGALLPDGWSEADFDDSNWPQAVVLRAGAAERDRLAIPSSPYTLPEAEGIAPRTAIKLELRSLGSVPSPAAPLDSALAAFAGEAAGSAIEAPVWDLGGVTLATPWVAVAGPSGSLVDLYAGEDRRDDGRVEFRPRNWTLRYRLRGSSDDAPERIEAFDAVGFRYLQAVPREGARVVAAGAIERRYPRDEGASFECDDERLNTIWRAGLRTLDVSSSDAFIDCPGREQRAWLGDAYIHTLVSLVTNPDTRLVRRNLYIAAQSQRADGLLAMASAGDLSLGPTTIPDYSLHWIRALARYVEWTGDKQTARQLLPVALDILAFFERYRESDGLLHGVPGWVFIDWATTERGECIAALDALLHLARVDFDSTAARADFVYRSTEEQLLERRQEVERRTLQKWLDAQAGAAASPTGRSMLPGFSKYWDIGRSVMTDALINGRRSDRVSQQTNALALLTGAVPEGECTRTLDYILDEARLVVTPTYGDATGLSGFELQRADPARFVPFDERRDVVAAQPFFAHLVHQAVVQADRADLIPTLCLKWWPMVADGQTTLGEFWTAKPGAASRAHAWSATPTYDLIRHTLGLQPPRTHQPQRFQPVTWRLRPQLGQLNWLRARVPMPSGGWLEVDLRGREGTISVPPGTDVDVPGGDPRSPVEGEARFSW